MWKDLSQNNTIPRPRFFLASLHASVNVSSSTPPEGQAFSITTITVQPTMEPTSLPACQLTARLSPTRTPRLPKASVDRYSFQQHSPPILHQSPPACPALTSPILGSFCVSQRLCTTRLDSIHSPFQIRHSHNILLLSWRNRGGAYSWPTSHYLQTCPSPCRDDFCPPGKAESAHHGHIVFQQLSPPLGCAVDHRSTTPQRAFTSSTSHILHDGESDNGARDQAPVPDRVNSRPRRRDDLSCDRFPAA